MEHKWKIMDSKYLQYPIRIAFLLLKLISFKSWEGNWKYNVQTLVDLTWPFHVLRSKKEKWEKSKKRRSLKAQRIKRLLTSSKCYCFSHSGASRIQKCFLLANDSRQYFSVFHGPLLWNLFCMETITEQSRQ